MKKIVIVFVTVFCANTLVWSQEELKYFKSDNAFYLGNTRLLDSEIKQTLSKNLSALEAWEKGNKVEKNHRNLKLSTYILLGTGAVLVISPLLLSLLSSGASWDWEFLGVFMAVGVF